VELVMPESVGEERQRLCRAYGAKIVFTDALSGSDGAIVKVREMVAADPDRYFYADQYRNPANPLAHYRTTGPEIWEQTSGRVTHFVAGLGTSGTFVGVGRRLRKFNAAIKLISFQPDSPFHGLEGLKHMESAIVPSIYDPTLADEDLRVDTEHAYRMVRRLAREEGMMAGISSGAAMCATLQVARKIERDKVDRAVIVTIFPDGAEKYLSESFWNVNE
jgi:S-sulfo-L-cysteine synthase (O-acetyl-L-serine-dependent)